MFNLPESNIHLAVSADNKQQAITLAANALEQAGYVESGYLQGMLGREQQTSTFLGNGIAIPHGTLVAKDAVLKTGIVFCQYPEGVSFSNDPNEKAYLVIGIAAQNNEHIGVIAALTNALDSEADIEMLKNTSDPQAVLDILSR